MVPAGGLSPNRSRWIHPKYHFLVPVKVLSRVFRGKFTDGLKWLFRQNKLRFHGTLKSLDDGKAFHRWFLSEKCNDV